MMKLAIAGIAVMLAAIPALAQSQGDARRGPAQPLTRAEVQSRVEARFARLDSNRDGFVTQAEVRAGIDARRAQRQAQRGERRAQLFARLDANGDGSISRQEFEARPQLRGGDRAERRGQRLAQRRGPGGARGGGIGAGFGLRAFAMLDANSDGRVSLAEANARALARFERVDLNRDGTITPEERRAARAQRPARRGS